VFAVGDSGTILHYVGNSWSAMPSGTLSLLTDVWGSSATDVFAVGQGGTILHYSGVTSDDDDDGVPNNIDRCPDSSLNPTIVIGGCNTGVINQLFEDGCTMQDLTNECLINARNRGGCVASLTNEWKKQGLITGKEKGSIQSCAAKAK
jgi:hypothetical protein